ncbi:MAG: ATP-binding cassette domain-containing protein [Candidatus Dormibacteria bacterium]
MIRRIAIVAGIAIVAWFVWPAFASGPQLDHTALALALAGPAVAAAIAAATGRPILVATALAGAGGYVSGALSIHDVIVPVAIVLGAAAGGIAAAVVALLCARSDQPAVLVITLVLAIAGGAAVQALPGLTGAESGLGPLAGITVPLGGARLAMATPIGDYHILLAVAAAAAVVAALAVSRGPGAAWRAVGSDRLRARDSGLSPLRAEVAALALGGFLAAICGALAAHVSKVATPQSFALDLAALPLLAALAAGREPIATAGVAVATGLAAQVVLPAAGWQGPPDATSLSLGVLAVAALFTLLPGPRRDEPSTATPVDGDAPWPLESLHLRGSRVTVHPITVRARNGEPLLESPAFTVDPGAIRAVVGPNGAGKTTLLRTLAQRSGRDDDHSVTVDGDGARLAYLPQEGGGFGNCTVDETLLLAARRGRTRDDAAALAGAWRTRLALDGSARTLCAELSAGRRRLLDLARVLLGGPTVLVCDEPLAGLDDAARAAAVACLRAASRAGVTVLIAEHDRTTVASLTDSVLELERPDWAQARTAPQAASP